MCPSKKINQEGEQPWRPWERQEICGLSHNAPQDFTLPGLSVSVPNSHKCDFEVCNATFKRESELKRHKLSKHFRKYERCKDCNKIFTRKDNLTRHMKLTHSTEVKPNCRFCLKNLSRRDAVQRHEQTCSKNPSRKASSASANIDYNYYQLTHRQRLDLKLRRSQHKNGRNVSSARMHSKK